MKVEDLDLDRQVWIVITAYGSANIYGSENEALDYLTRTSTLWTCRMVDLAKGGG